MTVSYEYDKLNRLICEETVDSDSNLVVKYVYTLGASGERLKVEELDRTVEYGYDELYRLTSETITKGKNKTTCAYEYDSVSNRTLKTVNGVDTVYIYNSLNQLISENDTTYEYDLNGNLVRVIGVGKSSLYEYNAENKLVKATVQQGNNVVVETYTYDYAGNRTSKTTKTNGKSPVKVKYLNDNSSLTNVLVEIGTNGDEICYYTIGADLVSQEIDGEVYTYIYDGHGTVRALANSKGKVTDTYTYDAFGNLISSTGSTANNYLYCGEQFDETTGLYYLRARYMDTSIGRFISQDSYAGSTADPASLHKYLYCNADPVNNIDPSGYFLFSLAAGSASSVAIDSQIQPNYLRIFYKLTSALDTILVENFVSKMLRIFLISAIAIANINISFYLRDVELTKSFDNNILVADDNEALENCFSLGTYIKNKVNALCQERKKGVSNLHHIVAKKSYKAAYARSILFMVGIDINDNRNLVDIKDYVHFFMHTSAYYSMVNSTIWMAYEFSVTNSEFKNVEMALLSLKILIKTIDSSIT